MINRQCTYKHFRRVYYICCTTWLATSL
ncbi:TRASH domain-containing protein [Acinetobacter bereziniae]|nr:TRASH domain-containing protein [Acinetobacter bereziniae]